MSLFLVKSILALLFLVVGFGGMLCMMALMGKADRKMNARLLRKTHKTLGFLFLILLVIISYFCIRYLRMAGDQLPFRAVLHSVLALTLFVVLVLKILVVRYYKQLLKYAPVMGMIVFSLAFLVTGTSAGYYFLRASLSTADVLKPPLSNPPQQRGNVQKGRAVFEAKCSGCHYANREDIKHGPGLKDLLTKKTLPHSGRPATLENVKQQLLRPVLAMPSFVNLPPQDRVDLLEYLKTL